MTITINKVDQDLCGHFLWDLADMAIRDKFKFNLNGDSLNAVGTNNVQNAVVLDEFEANHSIVVQAFKYLSKEPLEQTKDIGQYLLLRLPYHLNQLRKLEDDDQGALTPHQRLEIGQNLYKLFKDDVLVQRHKATFQQSCWTAADIMDVQKWMSDTAVTRRLDRKWQDKLQAAVNPTKGYLEELVRVVVQGLLKDRTWEVSSACIWLKEFIAVVSD